MELFEELSKADPSWPEPNWIKNPPKEMNPNFPGRFEPMKNSPQDQ